MAVVHSLRSGVRRARRWPWHRPQRYADLRGRTGLDSGEGQRTRKKESELGAHSPVRNLYCAELRGTTLSLPCRTSGESANDLFALTSPRVTGSPSAFPALTVTRGFFGSESSTETTVAVPTALLWSPVS